ncbi:MAG: hypothetical protein FD123_3919 [Bacteroidetes bacterium]|nr:MAG: hypothetical protein FD123_3919 [Bacteroidota bacterium]
MKITPKTIVLTFVASVFLLSWAACDKDLDDVDCSTTTSNYAADIKPIITANCNSSGCHGTGSSNGDFTTYAGLKTVADNGRLQSRVIVERDMPPSGPLNREQRIKIKCWIDSGAPNN